MGDQFHLISFSSSRRNFKKELANCALVDQNFSAIIPVLFHYEKSIGQRQILKKFIKMYEKTLAERRAKNYDSNSSFRNGTQIVSNMDSFDFVLQSHPTPCVTDTLLCILIDAVHNLNFDLSVFLLNICQRGESKALYKMFPPCRTSDNSLDKYSGIQEFYLRLSLKETNHLSAAELPYWIKDLLLNHCSKPNLLNPPSLMCSRIEDICVQSDIDEKEEKSSSPSNENDDKLQRVLFLDDSDSWPDDDDSVISWHCSDCDDESNTEDIRFCSATTSMDTAKAGATASWIQSNQRVRNESESSSDGSIVFEDVITEHNVDSCKSTKGSLFWMNDDFSDDESLIMFSDSSSSETSSSESWESFGYQDTENLYIENSLFDTSRYIKCVNEQWNDLMQDVASQPKETSKISFAPDSSLVMVRYYEPEQEPELYDASSLDRLRFQRRINEFSVMLSPFLCCEHRAEVQRRNNLHLS